MENISKLKRNNWKQINALLSSTQKIPEKPGVYAFISYKSFLGIPTETNVENVGMTNNLRRRFKEHNNLYRHHNDELYEILIKFKNLRKKGFGIDFWFLTKFHEKSVISELEKLTINQLSKSQKLTNKILYKRS